LQIKNNEKSIEHKSSLGRNIKNRLNLIPSRDQTANTSINKCADISRFLNETTNILNKTQKVNESMMNNCNLNKNQSIYHYNNNLLTNFPEDENIIKNKLNSNFHKKNKEFNTKLNNTNFNASNYKGNILTNYNINNSINLLRNSFKNNKNFFNERVSTPTNLEINKKNIKQINADKLNINNSASKENKNKKLNFYNNKEKQENTKNYSTNELLNRNSVNYGTNFAEVLEGNNNKSIFLNRPEFNNTQINELDFDIDDIEKKKIENELFNNLNEKESTNKECSENKNFKIHERNNSPNQLVSISNLDNETLNPQIINNYSNSINFNSNQINNSSSKYYAYKKSSSSLNNKKLVANSVKGKINNSKSIIKKNYIFKNNSIQTNLFGKTHLNSNINFINNNVSYNENLILNVNKNSSNINPKKNSIQFKNDNGNSRNNNNNNSLNNKNNSIKIQFNNPKGRNNNINQFIPFKKESLNNPNINLLISQNQKSQTFNTHENPIRNKINMNTNYNLINTHNYLITDQICPSTNEKKKLNTDINQVENDDSNRSNNFNLNSFKDENINENTDEYDNYQLNTIGNTNFKNYNLNGEKIKNDFEKSCFNKSNEIPMINNTKNHHEQNIICDNLDFNNNEYIQGNECTERSNLKIDTIEKTILKLLEETSNKNSVLNKLEDIYKKIQNKFANENTDIEMNYNEAKDYNTNFNSQNIQKKKRDELKSSRKKKLENISKKKFQNNHNFKLQNNKHNRKLDEEEFETLKEKFKSNNENDLNNQKNVFKRKEKNSFDSINILTTNCIDFSNLHKLSTQNYKENTSYDNKINNNFKNKNNLMLNNSESNGNFSELNNSPINNYNFKEKSPNFRSNCNNFIRKILNHSPFLNQKGLFMTNSPLLQKNKFSKKFVKKTSIKNSQKDLKDENKYRDDFTNNFENQNLNSNQININYDFTKGNPKNEEIHLNSNGDTIKVSSNNLENLDLNKKLNLQKNSDISRNKVKNKLNFPENNNLKLDNQKSNSINSNKNNYSEITNLKSENKFLKEKLFQLEKKIENNNNSSEENRFCKDRLDTNYNEVSRQSNQSPNIINIFTNASGNSENLNLNEINAIEFLKLQEDMKKVEIRMEKLKLIQSQMKENMNIKEKSNFINNNFNNSQSNLILNSQKNQKTNIIKKCINNYVNIKTSNKDVNNIKNDSKNSIISSINNNNNFIGSNTSLVLNNLNKNLNTISNQLNTSNNISIENNNFYTSSCNNLSVIPKINLNNLNNKITGSESVLTFSVNNEEKIGDISLDDNIFYPNMQDKNNKSSNISRNSTSATKVINIPSLQIKNNSYMINNLQLTNLNNINENNSYSNNLNKKENCVYNQNKIKEKKLVIFL